MKYGIVAATLLLALPAAAQNVTVRNGTSSKQIEQFMQQMQGALASGQVPGMTPQQQQKLQLGLISSKVYGCTEQTVGKPRVDAFINEMKAVGQQVEGLCKAGRAPEARQVAVANLSAKANDPVAIAAKRCYYEYKPELEPLLVTQVSPQEVANYERWADDPAQAEAEVTEKDICKGTPTVAAAPSAPITTQPVQDIR